MKKYGTIGHIGFGRATLTASLVASILAAAAHAQPEQPTSPDGMTAPVLSTGRLTKAQKKQIKKGRAKP